MSELVSACGDATILSKFSINRRAILVVTRSDLRNNASAGCEFGDKASWCASQPATDCYRNEDTCCETCHRLRTGPEGCEYGDRAGWCNSYVTDASMCQSQDVLSQCCQTCGDIGGNGGGNTVTPPSSCSDKATWCPSITGSQCYDSRETCCHTCTRLRISDRVGCEYGDKAPWCSNYVRGRQQCDRPEVADLCCHSCAPYLGSQPTTTTQRPNCSDNASWCAEIFPGHCYDPSVANVCCATCSRHKKSNPGCLYGDRYSWCKQEYCSTNANDCCATC